MDSNVIRRTTPEQKEVVDSIKIPSFINQPREMSEEDMVMLNNIPGTPNSEIEELNHLNELGHVASRYLPEEWERVLRKAPDDLLVVELKRRLNGLRGLATALDHATTKVEALDLKI